MRLLLLTALLLPISAQARPPTACSHWPVTMALMGLKNAGLVDPSHIDDDATKAILLATERLPKGLFKQVYKIDYFSKDKKQHFITITVNEFSHEECSISDVSTYVVSKELK